jgi:hypothetical protein
MTFKKDAGDKIEERENKFGDISFVTKTAQLVNT